MAGDWIKMRVGIADEPEVIGIAGTLGIEEDAVVGKLHRLWSWADQHTVDGNAPSVTETWLDRYVGVTGFASAMQDVGWLQIGDGHIVLPDFDKHNGQTGKSRALTARRVKKKRTECNAPSVTPSVTSALPKEDKREDKREEDKEKTPPAAESLPEQDRSLDEQRAATWQPDVEVLLLAAWEAADGRIRYPHAELTPGRRRMLLELSASPAWDWRAALEKFPLRCTQGRRDGWRPSIGWFLKEDSVDSILEGAYDWSPDSPGAKDRMAALEQYGAEGDDEEIVEVRNYSEGRL